MSNQIARLRQAGIGKESTKGEVVAPTYWIPLTTPLNPNLKVERVQRNAAIGRIESKTGSDIASKNAEPSLEGYLTDKGAGLLFLAVMGKVESESLGDGAYKHSYEVKNDNDHPALTISYKDLNFSKQIPYSMANEFTLDANVGDYLRFNSSFIGKYEKDGSLTPNFYGGDVVFVSRHIKVQMADDVDGLDDAEALDLQSIQLKIGKGTKAHFSLNSDEPNKILNGEFGIEGTIVALQADDNWRDLFAGNTTQAIRITIENDDVTIGTGEDHAKIVITIASVDFSGYAEDLKLEEHVKETVNFGGNYSEVDSSSLEIELTNGVASYN